MDRDLETAITATEPATTHITSHESVTTAIVSAIAAALECNVDSLDSIRETIDLESFDSLYANSSELAQADLRITFTVADCRVSLYGDGRVVAIPDAERFTDRREENS